MRSMKLLVAMAALAALVAGPVLAQEAAPAMSSSTSTAAPASTTKASTKKHTGKKHTGKKKKAAASTSAQ